MNHAKTFRLFISSTFSDFRKERQALHERVFPAIESYLKEKYPDYSFLPIDLRWGVSEEAQFDQKTLQLCLDEVRACKYHLHPNFLFMAGDRYGWVPLPYSIEQNEFNKIAAYLEKKVSKSKYRRLDKWYMLDENSVPVSYVLKERDEPYRAYESWEREEAILREMLQEAAEAVLSKNRQKKYFTSATEAELFEGISHYGEPTDTQIVLNEKNISFSDFDRKYVFGWLRTIHLSEKEKKEKKYKDYIDQDQNKASRFRAQIKESGIKLYEETVSFDTSVQDVCFEHEAEYLDRFVETMISGLKKSIVDQVIEYTKNMPTLYDQEEAIQKEFRDARASIFFGRKQALQQIKNYIDRQSTQPFVIHGKSGIGKSAFVAHLTNVILDKIEEKDRYYPVFFRFIGASPASSNIVTLLESLMMQFEKKKVFEKAPEYDGDMNKYFEAVRSKLEQIDKPVIIILDALDQLHENIPLHWLPDVLKPQIKIILSVLDENEVYYYEQLSGKYGGSQNNFLEIQALDEDDSEKMLNALLEKSHRKLTSQQSSEVKKQINKSGYSPLYIKMALEEVKTWQSSDELQTIEAGIPQIIREYIDNLHQKFHHNPKVVHKVLGYIKASKDGISEQEMLAVLSRDDELLKELEQYNELSLTIDGREVQKFPASVWVRLYEHIKPFLTVRMVDGQNLMKFFHRQFDEVVGEYVYESDKLKFHTELADYFLTLQNQDQLWDKRYNNLHMLDELPYHLFHSNNASKLKDILFDLEFAGSIYDNYKQDSFRQILESSVEIDDISSDEIYPWESFYREKEHLILSKKDSVLDIINPTETTKVGTISFSFPNIIEWNNHRSLYIIAYEDGDNSPIRAEAQKLLEENHVCWSFLKKKYPNEYMQRTGLEKLYTIYGKYNKFILLKNNTLCLIGDKSILVNKRKLQKFSWETKFKYDQTSICVVDENMVYRIDYQGLVLNSYGLSDEKFVIAYFRNDETYIITRKEDCEDYNGDEYCQYENHLLVLDKNYNLLTKYKLMPNKEIENIEILSMGILLYTYESYEGEAIKECFYFDFTTEWWHSLFGNYGGYVGFYESISYEFVEENKKKILFIKKEPYVIGFWENEEIVMIREYVSTFDLATFEVVDQELGDKKDIYRKKKQNLPLPLIEKEKINLQNGKYFIIGNNEIKFFDKNKIGLLNNTIKIKYELLPNKAVIISYNNTIYLFNFKELKKLDEGKNFIIEDEHIEVNETIFDFDGNKVDTKYKLNDQYYETKIKGHYIDEQELPYFADTNCDGKLLYISGYPYGLYISNCHFSILDIHRQ